MKHLNSGSVTLDKVYQVPHFLQAGETLSSRQLDTFPGGKGLNQSIAAARAGVSVAHAGRIGADGAFLRTLLAENGVDTRLLREDPGPTGHAVIQVDPSGQNCILLFGGANQQISPDDVEAFLAPFGPEDVLLVQNETSCLPQALAGAAARGIRTVLNPSPISPELLEADLSSVALFLLNEVEGAALGGGVREPEAILDALEARWPQAELVLTLGSQGARYRGRGRSAVCPAFSVEAVDTTAAGDCFTGYFLSAWLEGQEPEQCLRFASAASAIAVGRPGAAPSIPHRSEVTAFLSAHGF